MLPKLWFWNTEFQARLHLSGLADGTELGVARVARRVMCLGPEAGPHRADYIDQANIGMAITHLGDDREDGSLL